MVKRNPGNGFHPSNRAWISKGLGEQGFLVRASHRAQLVTALAALIALVAVTEYGMASSSRVHHLRHHERELVRTVESAKTTIRWFERHGQILYSPSRHTRRIAWHAVNLARRRVIVGRRDLRWTRKEIRRLTPRLIPHRAQWLCIHRYEAGWDRTDNATHNTYFGGLQMDREFQQTYGLGLYRRKGTADHWTPDEQMLVAERAYLTRGFGPWPETARKCGLL